MSVTPAANTGSTSQPALNYVNVGCGTRFHNDWINVDIVAAAPQVIQHNIINGLPFKDSSVEVIYHSHVLEHLPKSKAPEFIKECYRVLKPGGIIRIAVPDLEGIVRNYLKQLEASVQGEPGAADNYDWMMLELIDQCVRSETGGEMLQYLRREKLPNQEFIYERVGNEARAIRDAYLKDSKGRGIKRKVLSALGHLPFFNSYLKGRYRSGGEIHQWMYDRFSLSRLLTSAGFSKVKVQTATESYIPGWNSFELDSVNGIPHKPDSLFMEAVKP